MCVGLYSLNSGFDKKLKNYLVSPRKDRKDIHPPAGLLPTGSFYESDPIGCRNGQAELIASHILSLGYLKHPVHVHHTLRDGGRLWKQSGGNYVNIRIYTSK